MVMVVIMLLMIVMMVAAAAFAAVLMVMVMVFLMLMVMMVMMRMLVLMVMMMVAAAAFLFVLFLLLVEAGSLQRQLLQLGLKGVFLLHGLQDLLSGELVPGRGDDGGHSVMLPQQGHHLVQLLLLHAGGAAEDDGAGVFDLVIEKLAEVFHIHFALAGVGHGGKAVEDGVFHIQVFHRADHIGKLAHAGGLDEDPVGMILLHHLAQRLAEIAHQTAADAAGVHLGDVDARILQKAAVDADLAEFVFDEHQLLALIGLPDQLFNERGLACAQKAGENVDLGHNIRFLYDNILIDPDSGGSHLLPLHSIPHSSSPPQEPPQPGIAGAGGA